MNKIKIEEMNLNIREYGVDLLLTKSSVELLFKFINKLRIIDKCNSKLLESNYKKLSINGVSLNTNKLMMTKPMLINISSLLKYINIKSILDTGYIESFEVIPNLIYGNVNEIDDIVKVNTCNIFTINEPKIQFVGVEQSQASLQTMYLHRDANGRNIIIMCDNKYKNSSEKILVIEEFLKSSVDKETCYQVLTYEFDKLRGCYLHTKFNNDCIRYKDRLYDAENTIVTNTSIMNSIYEDTQIEHYTDEDSEFKSMEKVIGIRYKHRNERRSNINNNANISKMLTAIDSGYVDAFNVGSYLFNETVFKVSCYRETSIESVTINSTNCCYANKLQQPICKYTGLSLNTNTSDVKNNLIKICRDIFEKTTLEFYNRYCIEQIQLLENAVITEVDIRYINQWFNRNDGELSTASSSIRGIMVSIIYVIDECEHELVCYVADNMRDSWYTCIRNLSTKSNNESPIRYSKQYGNGGKYIDNVFEVNSKIFIYEPKACLRLDIRNKILSIYDTKKYLKYNVLLNEVIVNEIVEKVTNISSAVEIMNKVDVKILMSKFTLKSEDDYCEID